MNQLLIMIPLLLSTLSHFATSSTSFDSHLNLDDLSIFDKESPKTKILTLNQDVVISSSIQIRSEDVTLIGNRNTFTFQQDIQQSSIHSSTSPNQAPTKVTSEQTQKANECRELSANFMFEVTNSTFSVSGVNAIVTSGQTGICLIAGSTLRFSESSIACNDYLSPIMIKTSESEGTSLGSTVVLSYVTHHSVSGHIAPFVGMIHPQTSSNTSPNWSDLPTAETESINIVGTGLSLDSKHLFAGTGPLFSFGLSETDTSLASPGCLVRMETNLIQSSLKNVTSSSPFSPGTQLFGSEVSQRVAGSCVKESTNHDSGTGMMSPNMGGNLVCLNTSFSSCIRQSNADIDIQHENITITHIKRTVVTSSSTVTSVKFTLCTFNDMTIPNADGGGGSAIFLQYGQSFLTVTQCFFHKCRCTGSNNLGGAIYVFQSSSDCPVSLSFSSYTECTTTGINLCYGGSVSCVTNSSFSINDCFFEKCAAGFGGALSLKNHSLATLSNCAFVSCSSESWGGAMELYGMNAIDLSFLQFRGCSVTYSSQSNDIYFWGMPQSNVNSDTVKFCDSTSARPNVVVSVDSGSKDMSSLVPQVGLTPTVEVSVSISGETATVTAAVNPAVNGTMGILLDGSNVPRLVHIVFGSDSQISTTGSVVVSSGANGVIPPADKYELRSSSIASDYFLPTSVQSAHSSLSVDGNTTTIVLNGIKLNEGSYSMLIRNGEDTFNISLNRFNSTTLVGTAPLYPSTADGRLDWATEYQVAQVMWLPEGEQNDQVVAIPCPVTFITPAEPPRIESVARSLSGKKDLVIVELIGTKLTSAGQTVVISGSSGNISSSGVIFNVTSAQCFVNFSIGSSEDPTHVVFGGQYELLSVGTGSSSFAVNGGIFFTVPHPPKITSIVPQTKVSSSSFLLSVSGENLPSGSTYLVTLTSDHTFNILFSSAIAGTATIQIGRSGEVEYDTEYTIKSIIRKEEGKDDEHILFSAATFKTPLGPTLSFISSSFHSSDPNFLNVSLTTARMPSEDLILTLETAQLPIETVHLAVSHSDVSTGFILVEVYGKTDTLKYGTEYSVVKMKSSSVVAVVTAQPFSTPDEPIRITAAACSLGGDQQKSALVTLTGVKLGGGKDFKVTVRKMVGSTPSGGEIVLPGTFTGDASSTTHIHDVVIFGAANPLLSYETKYLITKFTVDGEVSVVNADVTFSVDPEPARLTSLESVLQYSSDEKNATIALSGIGMVGEYTLTLSVNSSASVNVTLDATFDAEGSGIVTAVLFDLSDPPVVDLSYNTRYEVVSVKQESNPIFYENGLVFTTIPVPRRLLSISTSNYVVGMDFLDLSFDSVALPSEATFTMTLESVHSDATTPHRKVIILETDQFGQLTPHRAQLYPFETETEKKKGQLEYDTLYKVVSITESSTLIHFEDIATRIQTPTEPARIVGIKSRQLNNVRTKMIVSFEGRALSSRSGKVSLTSGSTSLEWVSDVVVNQTHCTAEFAVGSEENSAHMKYGEEYTLKGSWTSSTGFHVENGVTLVVPFPPKITNMKFEYSNKLHTGCFVTFTGTDLIVGNSLKITLNNSFSFIATVVSESEAKSSELLIGWPETIPYNTVYTLTSVEATKEDDGKTIFVGTISDTTGYLPDDFTIFVDSGSTSDSTLFCGDKIRPCCSIEDGWKIVEGVGISSLSISVLCNTTQKEQVRMLLHHQVVIASGPSTKPELFVFPSSTSSELEGEGMIEVSGGRLYIHQVDVALSDSPSLIFIRMVGGHLTVEMCSLVGQSSSHQINVDSSTALCEWDTGILTLVDSTTTITSTQLTHLSQGAINMKGSTLTIRTSSFDSNTPLSSSFPSLRHNIRCSEGGEIEVGSLNGGDGKADHPHLWLSHDDCLVSGEDVNVNAPFFIPTLSSSSTSTLNKTTKAFQLTIDGATLIPCSLFLEVFEKGKDGKEGRMKPYPLTQDSSSHFNDTTIVLSLPLSSLSSFDDFLEWRGRLVYGKEQVTATSFVIQKSAADRIAQAVNENMKWWLPLVASVALMFVIVLVVVLVCCRRRRARKNGTNIEEMKETDQVQMDEEKIEIVTDNRIGVNSIQTFSSSESLNTTDKKRPEPSDALVDTQNLEEVLPCCGDMKDTVYVSKDRTLYNALHSENRFVIQVRQAQLQLVKGLKGVAKRDREPAILRALTAHNILFDAKQNVCLKLNLNVAPHTPLPNSTQQPQPDHQMPEKEHHQEPTVETNESKPTTLPFSQPANEGVRWYAPEVISNKPHINAGHGAVFSLGLVLWEMETGYVPFGEQDAVNASRQIVTGAKPKMELVQNQEMRELIEQCLSLNPDDRPELDTIEATLTLIPEDRSVHHLTLVQ